MRRFIERHRFVRFLITGGLNTIVTYLLYLMLLRIVPYQISYTISYVTGIVLSYLLSRHFVFRTHQGFKTVFLFPLVYVAQYVLGLLLLWLWTDAAGLNPQLGPLAVIAITVPMTYFLSRLTFSGKGN